MSHRRAALTLLLLLLLLLPPSLLAEPQVLQKRPGTPGASWDSLDFADLTARPTTLDGYGITDALQGDRPVVQTLLYLSDTTLVSPQDATLFYPSYGDLAGMVCDVMTAPVGADITLDLRVGDPLASVYAPGTAPRIVAGDTTTLTGTPEMLPAPVALVPRTKVQVRVLSAPDQNLDGTVGLVADLSLIAPAGMRILVLADGHVWTRAAYDVVAWTDTGLPAGGEWLGAVANYASLPGTPSPGRQVAGHEHRSHLDLGCQRLGGSGLCLSARHRLYRHRHQCRPAHRRPGGRLVSGPGYRSPVAQRRPALAGFGAC